MSTDNCCQFLSLAWDQHSLLWGSCGIYSVVRVSFSRGGAGKRCLWRVVWLVPILRGYALVRTQIYIPFIIIIYHYIYKYYIIYINIYHLLSFISLFVFLIILSQINQISYKSSTFVILGVVRHSKRFIYTRYVTNIFESYTINISNRINILAKI